MEHTTEHTHHSSPRPQNNLMIPVAIVIAGVFIAGAVFLALYLRGDSTPKIARPENQYLEKNLKPVSESDHVYGSITAPVIIVEHSDTDCPYCQRFHPTLQTIVDKYKSSGEVAWVYRHFAFHEKAPKEAEATECVASIAGNDKFWEYLDLLFKKKDFRQQPYKGLDPAQLPVLAASIGVSKTAVADCLAKNTFSEKIKEQYTSSVESGARGTPYSVIVLKNKASKELKKFVESKNNEYIAQDPSSPDIMYVSKDDKMIVLGGAMPQNIIEQIITLALKK